LRLFEQVSDTGKTLALMAHFTHPRELEPPLVATAISRIRSAGAVIRTQSPLIRTINDDALTWSALWRTQLRLGLVPYYMFVERDTGPHGYFAVPLARAAQIFRDAYSTVSGLCRTVRGPSMSATAGKVCVDGVAEIAGQRVFVLHMIQARDPSLVGRPFFAQYDPDAVWLSDLRPAFTNRFPFESAPAMGISPEDDRAALYASAS
jgi:L-lysine 2,3-aminomutase